MNAIQRLGPHVFDIMDLTAVKFVVSILKMHMDLLARNIFMFITCSHLLLLVRMAA